MIDRHDYPVTVRWSDGKEGIATSRDRLPELRVATPPEFAGPPHHWSPEHLFVASAASCFMTTYLAIAEASRLEIEGLEVPATGTLVRGDDRRYSIERITLAPIIRLTDEADRDKAARLAEKAEAACLVTRSMRSSIAVEPTFEVVSEPALIDTRGTR
ncbi:MAG: OsmC family protein [Thermoanaerobaculia bacterium]|nr:OsmC family protein [Thermoanaerobaculia bacterium]